MDAALTALREQVRAATADGTPLRIRGGDTKAFYGNAAAGEPLDTRALSGIVAYDPQELVLTAWAGTPLAEVESALAGQAQALAFEPPHFGVGATLGGCVAAGIAGPRRASQGTAFGGVRDFVLGATLLDGRGETHAYGGTVMKNVAGYDVSRMLAGSLGILGVITSVSLKVLPRPRSELTLAFELDEATMLTSLTRWAGQPLPISATAWHDGVLRLRLSGAEAAVAAASARLGGEPLASGSFWIDLREQRLPFFAGDAPLWRLSIPDTAAPLGLGDTLVEWNGALRWSRTALPAAEVRARAAAAGGHATLFRRGSVAAEAFTPLPPAMLALHRRLKAAFDPAGIFNRGRMYAEF